MLKVMRDQPVPPEASDPHTLEVTFKLGRRLFGNQRTQNRAVYLSLCSEIWWEVDRRDELAGILWLQPVL